jgi:hypothetical protein
LVTQLTYEIENLRSRLDDEEEEPGKDEATEEQHEGN